MTEDDFIQTRRGRIWLSVAAVIAIAGAAFSLAGIYAKLSYGQDNILSRLATNEIAVAAGTQAIQQANASIQTMANDVRDLHSDLTSILRNQWTWPDQKFWGQSQQVFWAEFRRLNPTTLVPPWPDPKRISDSEQGDH